MANTATRFPRWLPASIAPRFPQPGAFLCAMMTRGGSKPSRPPDVRGRTLQLSSMEPPEDRRAVRVAPNIVVPEQYLPRRTSRYWPLIVAAVLLLLGSLLLMLRN